MRVLKQATTKSKTLRRAGLACFCCLALAVACDRPEYTYSDDVPIKNTAPASFGGSVFGGSGSSFGGSSAVNPCHLDDGLGTPSFATQALSNQRPIRPDVYLELTDAEAATLKQTKTLLPPPSSPPAASPLSNLLNQLLATAPAAPMPLLTQLARRFQVTRSTWPNPWALRLLAHPGSEHMNPVRITFKQDAWFVSIVAGQLTVLDVNNDVVTIEAASAAPERIAAIYYVLDDRTPGAATSCDSGSRELALGNEAMVAELSLGTPEILAQMDADIAALSALFAAARPCSTFDKGGMTFRSYTVCQTWRFFDTSSEYTAYQWALSTPMESYKPTPQNLSSLSDALKSDRFEPDPFVAQPNPMPYVGTLGGAGGAGTGGGSGGVGGSSGFGGSGGKAGAGGLGGTTAGGAFGGADLGGASDGGNSASDGGSGI